MSKISNLQTELNSKALASSITTLQNTVSIEQNTLITSSSISINSLSLAGSDVIQLINTKQPTLDFNDDISIRKVTLNTKAVSRKNGTPDCILHSISHVGSRVACWISGPIFDLKIH